MLIAKLPAGDLIAIEARYHTRRLVGMYNRARPFKVQKSEIANEPSMDLVLLSSCCKRKNIQVICAAVFLESAI